MSALESYNLGDFLRIREEDENRRRVNSLAGLTLSDIILSEKRVAAAQTRLNRTLLDVIRVPERSSGVNIQQNQNQNQLEKEKKTWRAIKDRLRLKRNGAVLATDNRFHRHSNGTDLNRATGESTSAGAGHAAVQRDADGSFSFSRRGTTMRLGDHILLDPAEPARLGSSRRLSAALNDEREAAAAQEALREESPPPPPPAAEEEQPVRMSLMELLEETTERQMEGRYDDGVADEEEESEAPAAAAAAEQKCCVCMIRHKGAAFIPCGHTFCRMCSRELFVQRGNCPLCNTEISEILDIF